MMRTEKDVFRRIVDRANMADALKDALRGKRRRPAAAAFLLHEEDHQAALHEELSTGTWRPGRYRRILLSDPKRRLISAAPFRDRVVHHAIHRVIEPILSRRFMDESFACRPHRGTHRAVLRFQEGLRRSPWVGRVDVRRYFLEIRVEVLLDLVARRIADQRCLKLLERVLASGSGLYAQREVLEALGLWGVYRPEPKKGLPIGSLTSQLFANLYLDGLDHFVKRTLKVPTYIRYMDDAVVFGPTRAAVDGWRAKMRAWLERERGLETHEAWGQAQDTRRTFRFLGYVVRRNERRVASRAVRRLGVRLRADVEAGIAENRAEEVAEQVHAVVKSWVF